MKCTGLLTVVVLCCLMVNPLNAQTEAKKVPDNVRVRKMLSSGVDEHAMFSINMTTIDNNKKNFIIIPLLQIKDKYIRCIGVSIDDTSSLIDFLISLDMASDTMTSSDSMWFKSDYDGLLCVPLLNDIHDIKIYKDDNLRAMFDTYLADIQQRRNEIMQGADPGATVEFTFLDGKKLQGFIDCPHKSVLDVLFLTDKVQEKIIHLFIEYDVECYENVPSLIDLQARKVQPKREYSSIRFATDKLIKHPGLFTNQTVWMGRNYPPNTDPLYRAWQTMEQYQLRSLFSVTLFDASGQPHLFFLGDIVSLNRIERLDGPMFSLDDNPLYPNLQAIYDILQSIWNDPKKPMLYVDFYNRPPARGNLVEYVPSYHMGIIPHAVLKDTNGKLISLHDAMSIRSIFKADEMIDINKSDMDDHIDTLYSIEKPSVKINITTGSTPIEPVKIKSIQPYSSNMELEIQDVALYEQRGEPIIRNLFFPEEYTGTLHIQMTLSDSSPEAEKGVWTFVDEFTVFNSKGEVVPFTTFVEPIGMTDSLVRYSQPREILLVAIVKDGQDTFRLRFRDMPLILFEKEDTNTASSDDKSDK